ncbi:saccharopine dehydrogenase family protein [Parathalassolituus penaei]|uniref:Saccharopine dehydrogenase NADP-binding domain-containing protein n=1 Tax=Parathalassolituus penaei TaxID=2997323 RepID=A0A9X3EDF9_9GAMM|nr:saccharopine dehydrogenase NADP-binding domain-containing protein [Parathalassolituus penaei]MCY0964675.1 saccharopine dehydrogenase NADP-binding domain-containing protein [Parathalassolituus penaei]
MSPQFDVILFGATSFVGTIISRYLASQYGNRGELRWAIAGRNPHRLRQLRIQLEDRYGHELADLSILEADASRYDQLLVLCRQTRVVISAVGPYALYGEPLVRACADAGIDYVDLTGEPHWIRQMQDRYHQRAQQTGARLIHSCGFDSIPSDMGVWFLQHQASSRFGYSCDQIEMRLSAGKGGFSGGTVASLLNLLTDMKRDPEIAAEMADPYSACPPGHGFRITQPDASLVRKHRPSGRWSMPFIMGPVNSRVVHRSNALRNGRYGRHFRYDEAVLTRSGPIAGLATHAITMGGKLFYSLLRWQPTRLLMQRFVLPKPGQGPDELQQENGFFDMHFYGYHNGEPAIRVRVAADRDPGYGATARMIGEAAVCLAKDYHLADGTKDESMSGWLTPASVFDMRLIERLQQNAGVKFEEIGGPVR